MGKFSLCSQLVVVVFVEWVDGAWIGLMVVMVGVGLGIG